MANESPNQIQNKANIRNTEHIILKYGTEIIFMLYEMYVHTDIVTVHDYVLHLKPQNNVRPGTTTCPFPCHHPDDTLY